MWERIISTSVHEAYPGHYGAIYVDSPQVTSKVRKLINEYEYRRLGGLLRADDVVWGYGQPESAGANTEREAKLVRLGQLQDALLRDARFVVSIRLHTGAGGSAMSFDDAVNFFVSDGYQSRAIGTMETKQRTSDAPQLYYTLDKLEIAKTAQGM